MTNPFDYLASSAGKIVADAWTAAMLGIWNAGLWLLKLVLGIVDDFTTPDLSEAGPGSSIYRATFWIGLTLMIVLTLAQLGIAAFRRDGRSVGQVLVGTGQFLLVWVAWIGYGIAVLAACGGLTKALMETLLHVDSWAGFNPLGTFSTSDITDGTVATVLGFMGIFLVFAAIGHLLVMLTRAGALMVLAATTPISAAGLSSDFGRSWFWKSFRWFHAAAFTPVLMVLVLGVGVQMTSGVATGLTDDLQKAIGTAVPGVILICIGCLSPLALFKLLAFTDPGTSSGAGLRATLEAQGGISGLLGGLGGAKAGGADSTSSAASSTDEHGRSQGEGAGQESTNNRFGQAAAAGFGLVATVGARGAAIGAELTNQMGVGDASYVPDSSSTRRKDHSGNRNSGKPQREDDNPEVNGATGAALSPPTMPNTSVGGGPPGGGGKTGPGPTGGPGGAGAASAAGAGGAGGAGAAGAVPVVPV